MKRDVRLVRHYAHPPEIVWRALTDARLLGSWFMENDFEPALGRAFTFRMAPQRGWDGITYCEVTELEPGRRVAYTYRGAATGEKTLRCAGIESERVAAAGKGIFTQLDTMLHFHVAAEGTGTRLTLEHKGFRGFKQVLVSFVMSMGWGRVLKRLPPVLDSLCANQRQKV
ncbi:MAG: SRPBCC family protein [Bdellovibrionota bacterium]